MTGPPCGSLSTEPLCVCRPPPAIKHPKEALRPSLLVDGAASPLEAGSGSTSSWPPGTGQSCDHRIRAEAACFPKREEQVNGRQPGLGAFIAKKPPSDSLHPRSARGLSRSDLLATKRAAGRGRTLWQSGALGGWGDRAEVSSESQLALPAALPLTVPQGRGAAHCPS